MAPVFVSHDGQRYNVAAAQSIVDTTDGGRPSCHLWYGNDDLHDRIVLTDDDAARALAYFELREPEPAAKALDGHESPTLRLFSDPMRTAWLRGIEEIGARLAWLRMGRDSGPERIVLGVAVSRYYAALNVLNTDEQRVVNDNVEAWETTCRWKAGLLRDDDRRTSVPIPADAALAIVG